MLGKILTFTAFMILWAILFIGLIIVPREKRKIFRRIAHFAGYF